MRRIADVILVVVFVVLLGAPLANMIRPFAVQRPLKGALVAKPRPVISFRALLDETYQRAFTGWFEQAYGARPLLVRLDNTIDYLAFGETRPDKTVKVGPGRILFHDDQIAHFNAPGAVDEKLYAKRVRAAREALRARGIFLEFVAVPSKITVWRDAFPTRWTLPLAEPRPCAVNDAAFRRELGALGVPFVDGNALLEPLGRDDRRLVYGRSARHTSRPAACLMLDAALARVRSELRGATLPPLDCAFTHERPDLEEDVDFDLHRLTNVWPGPPDEETILGGVVPETVPIADRPGAMIMSSSFGWQFLWESDRNHLFSDLHFHYYGETMIDWGGPRGASRSVPLGSEEWKSLIATKKVVLFVAPEEYLVDDRAPFFVEVIRAFGGTDPATRALLP